MTQIDPMLAQDKDDTSIEQGIIIRCKQIIQRDNEVLDREPNHPDKKLILYDINRQREIIDKLKAR